jgi:hypothetical protein
MSMKHWIVAKNKAVQLLKTCSGKMVSIENTLG